MKQSLKELYTDVTSYARTIVIGDVHGCYGQLMDLLKKCNYTKDDLVILTGDLVDRGPKPVEVLEWCLENPNVKSVQGNHDNKLMRLMQGNDVKLTNGLQFTSNKIDQLSSLRKEKILTMLECMPNIIHINNINGKHSCVVHAGINGRIPISGQSVQNTLYMRGINPKNYMDMSDGIWHDTISGEYNVVCGHIVSDVVNPKETIYCLDGGCCSGGVLRALVIEDGKTRIVETKGLNILECVDHIELRERLAGQGLIRTDTLDDLTVYTYTDKAVYEKLWKQWPILKESRGHIFNVKTKECIAHTFPKFFNLNENDETQKNKLPWEDGYEITTKLDGWLGTLYRHNGEYKIATRGSFKSEGAVWATEWLQKNIDLSELDDDLTLVFEIISPITKIIVDYNFIGLVLLSAFNRHTGKELDYREVEKIGKKFGFQTPDITDNIDYCLHLLNHSPGNELEGFVIRFKNGLRVKIKSEDYFRMSRLRKGITPLGIWEHMSEGKINIDKFKDIGLSPSLYDKTICMASNLEVEYWEIMKEIKCEYALIMVSLPSSRKEFSLKVNSENCAYKTAMFLCYDDQFDKLSKYVKKLIRPSATKSEIQNA